MSSEASQPDNPRLLADLAWEAYTLHLFDPQRLIAWGDALITAHDGPAPEWMIGLSLLNPVDPYAVHDALAAVPGSHDEPALLSLLNALVLREWQADRLTIGQVRSIGWRIYRADYSHTDLTRWGGDLEYWYGEPLDEGQVTQAEMSVAITETLSPFAPSLPRLPDWF